MSSPPQGSAAWSWGRYLRLVILATAVTVAVLLAGWWVARRLGGPGAGAAVAAGCWISWAATVLGGLGAVGVGRRGSPAVIAAFAAMGLRLAVVVVLSVAAVVMRWFPTTPLLIATAASYLALLAVETRWVTGSAAGVSEGKRVE